MQQVPSLELCKKLKELWLPQDDYTYLYQDDQLWYASELMWFWVDWERYRAPTVMEMIDILPEFIKKTNNLLIQKSFGDFHVWYYDYLDSYYILFSLEWNNLPNLLAETIIRCCNEWYLDLSKNTHE